MGEWKPRGTWLIAVLAGVGCGGSASVDSLSSSYENSVGLTLVRVDPGSFVMGSERVDLLADGRHEPRSGTDPGQVVYEGNRQAGGGDETPHDVTLSRSFYASATEVTVSQWSSVMGDGSYEIENQHMPMPVSWLDAVRFCNALSDQEGLAPVYDISPAAVRWDRSGTGYRLPTEAEWEYAARAGTTTPFFFGQMDEAPYGPITKKTLPVMSYEANPWGLYDVHGNLWEWCWDGWGPYDTSRTIDPVTAGAQGANRVIRGGGACGYVAGFCSSSFRLPFPPLEVRGIRDNGGVGIRLVRYVESIPEANRPAAGETNLVVRLDEPIRNATESSDLLPGGRLRVEVQDDDGKSAAVPFSLDGTPRGLTPWEGPVAIGRHQVRLPWHSATVTIQAGGSEIYRANESDLVPPTSGTPALLRIPSGSFTMGTPARSRGLSGQNDYMAERQHVVTLTQDFLIGVTEITRGQWAHVMGEEAVPSSDRELPMENVSWIDAIHFCNRLSELENLAPSYEVTEAGEGIHVTWNREGRGYRLPTEAEWEYAARAGTTTAYFAGESISTDEANFDGRWPAPRMPIGQSRAQSVYVGSFAPNPWGLHDCHGNVAEWVWDWFAPYPEGAAVNPTGPKGGDLRVLRGGSFFRGAKLCRSADRYWGPIRFTDKWAGFRVARSTG